MSTKRLLIALLDSLLFLAGPRHAASLQITNGRVFTDYDAPSSQLDILIEDRVSEAVDSGLSAAELAYSLSRSISPLVEWPSTKAKTRTSPPRANTDS